MIKKQLIAMTLVFFMTAAQAEEDATLMHIEAHQAEFDYFVLADNGSLEPAGIWTDSIEIIGSNVVRTVKRVPAGQAADLLRTVVADRATLKPIRLSQRFGEGLEGVYHSEFRDGEFTQLLLSDTKTPVRQMSTDFSDPVVENNLQGLLAAALPFHERRSIEITGYRNGQSPSPQALTFAVEGPETIDVMGEEMQVWKITDPGSAWKYWVRKEIPYLVKVEHPAPGGLTLVSLITSYRRN